MKGSIIGIFLAITLTAAATTIPPANSAAVKTAPAQESVTVEDPPVIVEDKPVSTVLEQTGDMGQDYVNKIIFLGDSLTYDLRSYSVLEGGKKTKQVWTPSNGTFTLNHQSYIKIVYPPTGAQLTIRKAVETAKPEIMIINLGVNGISFMDKDYFKSEYKDLVTGIQLNSPETKIILQSIFPVASNYRYPKSINNTKIKAANEWILEIAEETGVRYLDTFSALIGDDGWLPKKYQSGDGIHMNGNGYAIVIDYLRTHGYK